MTLPERSSRIMKPSWNAVVLQPTSLCNLNCAYCYLPDRSEKRFVKPEIAIRVAETIRRQGRSILVLWHGGEPLMAGLARMKAAVAPFQELVSSGLCQHSLQTNATLIDDKWCAFFRENHFRVGVSIDGNASHTKSRVTWSQTPAFDNVMRGIETLREHRIPFGVIAVINEHNVREPEEFYAFLASLAPAGISINFEESEGLNRGRSSFSKDIVNEFWRRLFRAWRQSPIVPIRNFRDDLNVMNLIVEERASRIPFVPNLYPTIDTEGNVVMLSPEFIAVPHPERARFIVGNVMDEELDAIITRASEGWYVREFLAGVEKCRERCSFFDFCRGGQASNKYFEKGCLDVTETEYCKNARIAPVRAILGELGLGREAGSLPL